MLPRGQRQLQPNVTTAVPLILFTGDISHWGRWGSRTPGLSLNQCTSDPLILFGDTPRKKKQHPIKYHNIWNPISYILTASLRSNRSPEKIIILGTLYNVSQALVEDHT